MANSKQAKSEPGITRDYEIGHGKPPKKYQFKPGVPGNKKGRRKGSKNRKSILIKALNTTYLVQEGGKTVRRTGEELIIKRLVLEAVKGKLPAAKEVLKLADRYRVDGSENAPRVFKIKFV